jgi:hypothetical protein
MLSLVFIDRKNSTLSKKTKFKEVHTLMSSFLKFLHFSSNTGRMLPALPSLNCLYVAGSVLPVFAGDWSSLGKGDICIWASLNLFIRCALNSYLHFIQF